MDVKDILTFLEIADTKSFSVSADNLCVSQPAVSKRIATLEEQLSTRLFSRLGRGVILTKSGKLLIPSARRIAAEVETIETQIAHLGDTVSGTLSLGVSPYIAFGKIPRYLTKFRSDFPDVEVSLIIRQSPQLVEELDNELVEICLCELENSQNDGNSLWQEKLCFVVSAQHPLAELSDITIDELTTYPAVLPPPGSTSRMVLSNALKTSGYIEKNPIVVPDFHTLRSMVEIGIGWGVLPESMCEVADADATLRVLDVAQVELDLSIYIIHHPARTLSQAATAFIGQCR